MLRTNSKIYRDKVYQYLLDSISFIDDDSINPETDKESINAVIDTFKKECYHKSNIPMQQAFAEWLAGLPSCYHIDFANHAILEKAAQFHGIDEIPENKQGIVVNNWFLHIAQMTFALHEKLNK